MRVGHGLLDVPSDMALLILQNYWTNRDALLLPLSSLLRVRMLLHVYAADDRQVRALLA